MAAAGLVVLGYLALTLWLGPYPLWLGLSQWRKASGRLVDFFAAGHSLPGWLPLA